MNSAEIWKENTLKTHHMQLIGVGYLVTELESRRASVEHRPAGLSMQRRRVWVLFAGRRRRVKRRDEDGRNLENGGFLFFVSCTSKLWREWRWRSTWHAQAKARFSPPPPALCTRKRVVNY
jgi:hypothetical protein